MILIASVWVLAVTWTCIAVAVRHYASQQFLAEPDDEIDFYDYPYCADEDSSCKI